MNKNLLKLCETAIMIALATVLSMLKPFEMPQGGSITLFSMLPIAIIAYRYKFKWGIFTGFVYGIFQMILGANNLAYGSSALAVVAIILFDYLVAFAVIGLAGIFRDKFNGNQPLEIGAGILVACIARFACHFISGWTVWGAWADYYEWSEGMQPWLYSLIYNGTFMSVETVITIIGAVLICLFLDFRTDKISPLKRK